MKIFIVAVAKLLVDISAQMLDERETKEVEGIDTGECIVCNKHVERHGISVEETYDIAHIIECLGNESYIADSGDVFLCFLSVVAIGRENNL